MRRSPVRCAPRSVGAGVSKAPAGHRLRACRSASRLWHASSPARGLDLAASLRGRGEADVRVDAIAGLEITLTVDLRDEMVAAPNVVGILDGGDPELKDEYVVFSGHMDHVGMGSPDANGDSIFNGADDDASARSQ